VIAIVLVCACGGPATRQVATTPAPPAQPSPPASLTGIVECDDVIASYERYFRCDHVKQLPKETIDGMREAVDAMRSTWHFENESAELARDIGNGCKQSLDELKRRAAAEGCEL
jgi:hypothetical protein